MKLAVYAFIGLAVLAASTAGAQEESRFYVEPYAMFPNMSGAIGIGNLPDADVDEDPGDIFDNLQFGAMVYAEMRTEHWTFGSDILYMDLDADAADAAGDVASGLATLAGEVSIRQLGWELSALRRVNANLEIGIAAQYNDIESDLRVTLTPPGASIRPEISEDWIDPVVVMRVTYPLGPSWFVTGRGSAGGFDIGSESTWQATLHLGYRFSESKILKIGYRVIDVKYENGSGADRFVYDVQTFGPELRFGFAF